MSTGLGGFEELGKLLVVYGAVGLSAGSGSITGVIVNSKEKHCTRRKIIFNNLLWTFVAISLLGMVSIIFTRPDISRDFLIAFFAFSLMAIFCSQLAGYVGMCLFKNQIITKYKYLIIGLGSVFMGIAILCISESVLSGLLSCIIAGLIMRLSYGTSIHRTHTNILIYLFTGLLGTSMYFILGFVIFIAIMLNR